MRTLGVLTIAVGLLTVTVAACASADDPEGSIVDPPANKKKEAPAPSNDTRTPTAAPTPAPAPAPTPVDLTRDGITNGDETDIDCGGAKAAGCSDERVCKADSDCKNNNCKSGKCKPAAVATRYCADLGACCNSRTTTAGKLTCLAIQFAGKELACQAESVYCAVAGTPCDSLNKCCDQWDKDGYDSTECRKHNTGNASVCTTFLNQYKNLGYCK